jgi:integrase
LDFRQPSENRQTAILLHRSVAGTGSGERSGGARSHGDAHVPALVPGWIDAIGKPVGVQQKLMRHSDIRTTMNIHGDAATEDMREAHCRIVRLALQTV